MTEFSVMGRTVQTANLPPSLEQWLHAHWRFDEHETGKAGFDIVVARGARPRTPLPAPGPVVRIPRIELPCRTLGEDDWMIGDEAAGVRLALGTAGSRIEPYGLEEESRRELLRGALFVALYESLRASGLVPLHASVIARNGEATALLARSGTGKSSTLVQAVRGGWDPVAEDFAWLDPVTLQVYGWDRGVHLWPDARRRFAPDLPGRMGADGKLFIPWDALGGARPGGARLASVALLSRDANRPSQWEALPEREAVRALWESIGVPLSAASRAAVAELIPALLRRVRTRRLILGGTPLPLAGP
ncbi:MAG TPA: hypothetical protein VF647_12525 [Longimicrobium sp.]|jgi:hypothetical protein